MILSFAYISGFIGHNFFCNLLFFPHSDYSPCFLFTADYCTIVQTKRLLLFIGVFLCSFYVLSHRDGCDRLYLSPGVYTLMGGSRLSTSECNHGVMRYIYLQINTVTSASLQNSSCTGCAASGAREGSCCPHTG